MKLTKLKNIIKESLKGLIKEQSTPNAHNYLSYVPCKCVENNMGGNYCNSVNALQIGQTYYNSYSNNTTGNGQICGGQLCAVGDIVEHTNNWATTTSTITMVDQLVYSPTPTDLPFGTCVPTNPPPTSCPPNTVFNSWPSYYQQNTPWTWPGPATITNHPSGPVTPGMLLDPTYVNHYMANQSSYCEWCDDFLNTGGTFDSRTNVWVGGPYDASMCSCCPGTGTPAGPLPKKKPTKPIDIKTTDLNTIEPLQERFQKLAKPLLEQQWPPTGPCYCDAADSSEIARSIYYRYEINGTSGNFMAGGPTGHMTINGQTPQVGQVFDITTGINTCTGNNWGGNTSNMLDINLRIFYVNPCAPIASTPNNNDGRIHDFQLSSISPIQGCTDSTALNFNSAAVIDDGSCDFGYKCESIWYIQTGRRDKNIGNQCIPGTQQNPGTHLTMQDCESNCDLQYIDDKTKTITPFTTDPQSKMTEPDDEILRMQKLANIR